MSPSAQALRLHILMQTPDPTWVFDRLRVLNLIVAQAFFRCRDRRWVSLVVTVENIDDHLADFLVARLQQVPAVHAIKSKRIADHGIDGARGRER